MAADRPLRVRLGTVRVRTTAGAVLVAGLAMAVGALVLVAVLRDTLTREVEAAARLRGQDVASLLASGRPPDRGPLAVDDPEESLIQVLDERGQVVAASANAQGLAPLARLRPGESAEVEVPAGGAMEEDGEFLAVATGADTPSGGRTVVVARSTETVAEATAAVAGLLAVGLPLLLAVVAANDLGGGRAGAGPGGGDPGRGRRDLRQRAAPAGSRPTGRRRDRPPGQDHEPHAGAARPGPGPPAAAGLRRLPRAALPGGRHPPARRGRPGPPGPDQRRRAGGDGAGRGPPAAAPGRGPARC